jgi:hypothetical protein
MRTQNLKDCKLFIISIVLMLINSGFIPGNQETKSREINTLTKVEEKSGWKLLFDGKTFNGWRGLGRDHVPAGQWLIEQGLLRKVRTGDVKTLPDGRPVEGGDLITIDEFENFELCFEWRINKAGNSGLKYNVSEELSQKYGTKYSALGFEYQLLDDGDPMYTKLTQSQFSGSLYDLIPAKNIVLKPIGEFNNSRILVNGKHVEHWLNGIKVVEFEFGSKELDEAFKVSKFKEIPGFQEKRIGHLVLQDHIEEAWFRNIKIRELNK